MSAIRNFDNMNLVTLRGYACRRIMNQKDWYMNCVSCSAFEGCQVGKRVVDILESQTKPLDSVFEKAICERDPIQWLLQHGYYSSRGSAINNLNRWKREKGNKMSKKPKEKPASVKKLPVNERFEEALKHEDPIGWLVENGYYTKRQWASNKLSAWNKKKREGTLTEPYTTRVNNSKEKIRHIIDSSTTLNDLIFRYLKTCRPGTKMESASNKARNWATNPNYTDISRIEVMNEVSNIICLERYGKMTVQEFLEKYEGEDLIMMHEQALADSKCAANYTRANIAKHEDTKEEDDDEVSIRDFLNEMETKNTEPVDKKEDEAIEKLEEDPLYSAIYHKKNELEKRIQDIDNEIKRITLELVAEQERCRTDIHKLVEATKILGY